MSRKVSYEEHLADLINQALKTSNKEHLAEYLTSNSNLPGPRGNLELAAVFGNVVEDHAGREPERLWTLCMELTQYSPIEAPVNDPKEFLVFCGARGLGALGSSPKLFQKAMSRLKELACDPRWRTREGVAMAIQSMLEKQPQKTLNELEKWIETDNWLVMRAVAAGVAEPALLKDEQTAKSAVDLHKKIFAKIVAAQERKSGEFKTLKQGLGYSLSVVVCAFQRDGFEYMRQLVDMLDTDVQWILRENMRKNRLVKNFPEEVSLLQRMLI